MNTTDKLRLLGASSAWDTCGPNTTKQSLPGVYHAKTKNGDCRLLKVLYTNQCVHDCKYCCNSTCSSRPKASFEPRELALAFISYVKIRAVEGLFLSSAVAGDPDRVTDDMIETARLIRFTHHFKGYIHLKVLPGVSRDRIQELSSLADRISLNLEAPTRQHFSELSSTKVFGSDLMKRLSWMRHHQPSAGITTQFVVGAAGETDLNLLSTMETLYSKFSLRRVYFSAFQPLSDTPLQNLPAASSRREFRLYQTDWLMRVYKFDPKQIKSVLDDQGFLPLNQDPKLSLALSNPDQFPLDINKACRDDLLKVPGIGPKTAHKLIEARKQGIIFNNFPKLIEAGVGRAALPFIEVSGKTQTRLSSFIFPQAQL